MLMANHMELVNPSFDQFTRGHEFFRSFIAIIFEHYYYLSSIDLFVYLYIIRFIHYSLFEHAPNSEDI